jgi:hypothetical protein
MKNHQIKVGDLLIDKKSQKRLSLVVEKGVNGKSFWIFYFNGILSNQLLLLPQEFIYENFYFEQSLVDSI